MAGELIWARGALDDLEALASWIACGSPAYASHLVTSLCAAAERLPEQPEERRPYDAEEIANPLRWLQLCGYCLLYERRGPDIHLLAVVQAPPG